MSKKKKILFVNNMLWTLLNFRGHIIRRLSEEGHEVVLVTPAKQEDGLKAEIPESVRLIPVSLDRCGSNPLSDAFYAASLYRIYRRERPDYIFHYTIKPNVYGTLAAHRLGIPCTDMVAGLGYGLVSQRLVSRVARMLYRLATRRAEHLIVLNKMNRDYVLRHRFVPASKLLLLEGGEGIVLSDYPVTENAAQETTFLMIARVLTDKGYREFRDAAKLVKQREPSARFQLLGPVDLSNPAFVTREELEKDVQEGPLEYLGVTDDVPAIVSRPGTVVVLPSYHEGMSRSLMEACAMGRPIITTDIPGCRETVEDGKSGFLIPPRDTKALADAMLRYLALDEETKRSFAIRARKRAEDVFDIEHVVKVYKDILEEV